MLEVQAPNHSTRKSREVSAEARRVRTRTAADSVGAVMAGGPDGAPTDMNAVSVTRTAAPVRARGNGRV